MNNPNKTCGEFDNFDACYADNQVLKAKCDADIFVELVNKATGEAYQQPGVEIQVHTGACICLHCNGCIQVCEASIPWGSMVACVALHWAESVTAHGVCITTP